MEKCNKAIRDKMKQNGVKQWELAKAMGVCEHTVLRWLRVPLEGERLDRVNAALEQIERGGLIE